MAKAGTVLDLPNDKAKILGEWVNLNLTSIGHYALDILSKGQMSVEECLLGLSEDSKERMAALKKIHHQFRHPREETMTGLLKNVKCYDKRTKEMLAMIHKQCKTCPMFSKTPPKPVVSLPIACEFNEVLTMDLKEVKVQQYKYILHLIDGFTRMTMSFFMEDKEADTVIHHFMKNWVTVHRRPAKIWLDVGGEFNNTMRQLGKALGTMVETGSGYTAWMNGLNERNHCVVDRCFTKIMKEDLSMDPTIALAWAVAAKNGFPMHGGYSSYQLVYGKDPNMPNILYDKLPAMSGVTTSESVVAHISALHRSRIAFTEQMCDQKVRTALRHKVRAVERTYGAGEKVYYRRDGDKAEWRGLSIVIGNCGSVHYLVHQGNVIRVAACRLVTTGEAEKQIGGSGEKAAEGNESEKPDEKESRSKSTKALPDPSTKKQRRSG